MDNTKLFMKCNLKNRKLIYKMQLVYLWIKDYKNIKELGIPLEITYNESEKTAYTSSKESITIKLSTTDNYNVFGDNLNIKTFVGANGSGKSNITTALCSILRTDEQYDFENYFDNSKPDQYCLIYKDNDSYKYISSCDKIDLYIDNELQNLENGKRINCGLFRPFLNIEDDTNLTFPKDVHIDEIIDRKIKNYFYYDRFRMYDTSQTLKNLFKENESKNFEIFNGDNKYLVFDYYGYEIDIVQEFEWINRQLHNKIPLYFKKENIQFNRKADFVDMLTDSNNFIIDKAKTDGYYDIKDFVHNVVSQGCFMFMLIKIAELFSMLKRYENIITLTNLKNVLEDMVDFIHNEKAINKILSLNEIDIIKKHRDLRDFYKEIQTEFEEKIKDKSILNQFRNNNYLIYFSNLIASLVKLEDDLYNGDSPILKFLETKDGNTFKLNKNFLNEIDDEKDTEANLLLNNLGIFRRCYYKTDSNDEYYSFYNLSTGEQRLLRFFADILSLKEKKVDVYIFDEMDLSWHPEWQRKMVYYIKDFFDKCNSGYKNIIFTTHSPFILSDMPAQNVIMLYRDTNGIANLYNNVPNSFCANIHDLFNDNFFFNKCDGICTIGEFAKHYINNVKEGLTEIDIFCKYHYLNDNKFLYFQLLAEDLQSRIALIKEPVIRKSLENAFIERYSSLFFNNPRKLMLKYIELKKENKRLKKALNEKDKSDE